MTQRVELAARFLQAYAERKGRLDLAVAEIRSLLADALSHDGVPSSSVYGRAKTVESVRGKLLRKAYKKPSVEMMDQIGLRIVTPRASVVDDVVRSISKRFRVVKCHSIDKRQSLGLREFGYRSVHLVCRVPRSVREGVGLGVGSPAVFEVQVRSLLEHAWAEIEHGVVYKAGAELPEELRRRFASLAGAIELMEGEFERLWAETRRLARKEKADVFVEGFSRRPLDVPRLVAVLETYRPYAPSLMDSDSSSLPSNEVSVALLSRVVDALRLCGIRSTLELAEEILCADFDVALRKYSASHFVDRRLVPHLASCLLILHVRGRDVLETYFPEFVGDMW